jgi:hypothetical protein
MTQYLLAVHHADVPDLSVEVRPFEADDPEGIMARLLDAP